jgi:hypothetical protein
VWRRSGNDDANERFPLPTCQWRRYTLYGHFVLFVLQNSYRCRGTSVCSSNGMTVNWFSAVFSHCVCIQQVTRQKFVLITTL